MRTIDDGGPAFARPGTDFGPDTTNQDRYELAQQGMSLRDWFAGMAMQGMMATGSLLRNADDPLPEIKGIVMTAYAVADAMIAESGGTEK